MGTIEPIGVFSEGLTSNDIFFDRANAPRIFDALKLDFYKTGQPIEVDFRKLAGWVKLGDQFTHQIHPYPAKLLPNIASFFVRASGTYSNSCCRVIDPFCGSGTVALEASLAGHTPYVADANPLALLITKVKTTPYDTALLSECLQEIVCRAKRYRSAPEVSVVNERLWYSSEKKKKLEVLLRSVMDVEDNSVRDFFRLCFSVTAKRLSYADPAISVPVRLKTKPDFNDAINKRIESKISQVELAFPVDEFIKICRANIERVKSANLFNPLRKSAIIVGSDARNLSGLQSGCKSFSDVYGPSLIITSPPYGSAQKYIRASGISLNWLGFVGAKNLTDLEVKSIGREHAPLKNLKNYDDELPPGYERLLSSIRAKNETRYQITRQYLCEISHAFEEMVRVTSDKGRIVLVLGNNQVCGETLRNDDFAISIMAKLGMKLDLSLIDHIKSRGLMTKRNKTASMISRESVLVFNK